MKKQKHFTVCRWTPRVRTKGGGESKNKYFHNAFFGGDSGLYVRIFRYILYRIFPRDQNPLRVCMPIARYPHGVIYTSGETRLSSGQHIFYGTFFSWPSIFRFWKMSTPTGPIELIIKVRIIVVFKKIVIFKFTCPSSRVYASWMRYETK